MPTSHALGLAGFDGIPFGLIEGNTQRFRTRGGSALIRGFRAGGVNEFQQHSKYLHDRGYSRPRAPLLDVVLALFAFTPWNDNNILIVKGRDEIFPFGNGLKPFLVGFLGAGEQTLLDVIKETGYCPGQPFEGDRALLTGVPPDCECLILGNVLRTNLESEGDTLFRSSKGHVSVG